MSHDHAEDTNPSNNPSLESVVAARLSRRDILGGAGGAAALAVFGSAMSSQAAAHGASAGHGIGHGYGYTRKLKLGFNAVAKHIDDVVAVPEGYSYDILFALGDPMAKHVGDYSNDGTDDAASFEFRSGDHHDGMYYFGLGANGRYNKHASDRGLLCINHEAITPPFLHPTGPTVVNGVRTSAEEVLREFYVHGVAVLEIERERRRRHDKSSIAFRKRRHPIKRSADWDYVQDSRFNRRIHTLTDMRLSGPAGGTAYMITKYSPKGKSTRGTVNNCANGYTPWGTYLTCEENYSGYFRRIAANDNPKRTAKELASFARNGIAGSGRELWATVTPDTPDNLFGRWNTEKLGASPDGSDDYRNVANTYGWVVEIDPFDPRSTPRKRTALGRFAHEGAEIGPVRPGEPLVWYMGDDARNEYVYKFVSKEAWDPRDANKGLAAGDKYLDAGTLYVAQFLPDGSGQWIELAYGKNGITSAYAPYPFADQADVLINARFAADCVGATKMDRPEWAAVNSRNGEVYLTLTNNAAAQRPIAAVDAANPRFYNDPRITGQSQRGNPNGHIIRWVEGGGYADALSFDWDIYLFGARATASPDNVNLSGLTDANDFSSPDGAWFSYAVPGLLWLQTDDGAYTDVTNCMMLAAIPGKVGDGEARTITNVDGVNSSTITTYVGKSGSEKQVRRFLVGPKECEITGIAETPDGRTLFVNIQHPGESTTPDLATGAFGSHWPEGGVSRPRSATIVITRDDGGVIGVE
jgi:secreted PhoX family phosphatase